MWCKNLNIAFFRFVTIHAFDGRTDRIPIAIPRLHFMQRGKNHSSFWNSGARIVVNSLIGSRIVAGFRLIPKSATLNDIEWHNGRVFCVILPNSVALGLLRKSG